ncbi:hypothetical protein [Leptospira gomenensis]|nr:hypothetical protein [Leptospira gomenensis]
MSAPFLFVFFLFHPFSAGADPIKSSSNEIHVFINGTGYDRQIYFRKGNLIRQISRFSHWENIGKFVVSPDKSRLVVYHRKNDEKSFRLSVFDLEKKNHPLLSSFHPGMACHDLFWYADRIFFRTGTTGGGTFLWIYDKNLYRIGEIRSFALHIDTVLGIAIGSPVYPTDEGIFKIYNLFSGKTLEIFDYNKEVGEFYRTLELRKTKSDDRFKIEVTGFNTNRKRTFIKKIPKK